MGRIKKLFRWVITHKLRTVGLLAATLTIGYTITFFIVEYSHSPTDKTFKLSDGRRLAYMIYRESTDPGAPTVVFVHGAPADASSWKYLISKMPKDIRIGAVAIDRLGYGNSDKEEELELDSHARAISEFASSLERPPILVGHSYGGPVALAVAAHHPESIAGVILVAGSCDPYMKDTQWLRGAIDSIEAIVPTSWEHANAELLALTDENREMESKLKNVVAPVTVIHGTRDMVCPHDGTVSYLKKTLVNSRQVEVRSLSGVGHNIHFSKPRIVIEEIQNMAALLAPGS